jgi:hypothetical protein
MQKRKKKYEDLFGVHRSTGARRKNGVANSIWSMSTGVFSSEPRFVEHCQNRTTGCYHKYTGKVGILCSPTSIINYYILNPMRITAMHITSDPPRTMYG